MLRADVAVIGGGIVGLATSLAIVARRPSVSLVVLEKEPTLAAHQTGHNSGVVHAGLYYKPGSFKAVMCARGRVLLERYCEEHGVPLERCGKIVVATRPEELPRLDELERRGRANGLTGIRRIMPEELREREPHVVVAAALHVPETGIVDYAQVARSYARVLEACGGALRAGARVMGIDHIGERVVLRTTAGDVEARAMVSCAGLESDRVAHMAGLRHDISIVPFRGEYWMLSPARTHLVRNLVYPVPDPAFPFLGVHFTRRIGGGLEAGPNAVLALAREGYQRTSFDARDVWSLAAWPGFWRMARRHWKMGLAEQARSLSRTAFAKACAALVPEICADDLVEGGSGVRAQAVSRDGALLDDFAIAEGLRTVCVLNAPSPAATASLAIGNEIATRVLAWI